MLNFFLHDRLRVAFLSLRLVPFNVPTMCAIDRPGTGPLIDAPDVRTELSHPVRSH